MSRKNLNSKYHMMNLKLKSPSTAVVSIITSPRLPLPLIKTMNTNQKLKNSFNPSTLHSFNYSKRISKYSHDNLYRLVHCRTTSAVPNRY